jgi:hypothetical protein
MMREWRESAFKHCQIISRIPRRQEMVERP